jgi:hypothetical protein
MTGMIIVYIVIWLGLGLLGSWLSWRGTNNKFGWGLRATKKESFFQPAYLIPILAGTCAIFAALAAIGRYCFMSRGKALELYDKNKELMMWLLYRSENS